MFLEYFIGIKDLILRVKNPIAVNGIGPTPKNETEYKNFNPKH